MNFIEETLQPLYPKKEFSVDAQRLIKVDATVTELVGMLTRFHNEAQFEVLSTISCTDWIEEGLFHLNYILYSFEHNQTLFLKVKISRELKDDGSKRTIESIPSVHTIWPQAANFERDLWEMFGLSVSGHDDLREFFLEDWQDLPPNRREFDTLEFVEEHFDFRIGREDAKIVKDERAKRAAAKKAAREALKAKEEAEKNTADTESGAKSDTEVGGNND